MALDERAMQVAEKNASMLDDTFVTIHLIRLHLLRGNLPKAQYLIKVYDLEKPSEGVYYALWEMAQLVLLRAQIATLHTDPQPAFAIPESLSTLIAESERRERVTPPLPRPSCERTPNTLFRNTLTPLKVYLMRLPSARKVEAP